MTWSHGRQLDKFADIAEFKYNVSGIRTSKKANGFTTNFFLNGNKILRQQDASNTLTFYYGADGITGFHLSNSVVNEDFYYMKNAQSDIIGIYSSTGAQIAKYEYDAWGNCIAKYLQSDGTYAKIEKTYSYNDTTIINRFIAFKNPFRYRSYYYDFETNLYYLNSRYYDPEIGRFVNADAISCLDKNNINGLNLYVYCLNNPIMLTDEKGTGWWSDLWKNIGNFFEKSWEIIVGTVVSFALVAGGIAASVFGFAHLGATLVGAGVGGFIGGLQSKLNGGSYWGGYLGGAVSGALTGFGVSLGPVGAMVGGFLGNLAGTAITDAINGVNQGDLGYWLNLAGESALSGVIAVGAGQFGKFTDAIKPIFKDIFVGLTVWAEFAFSALTDWVKNIVKQIADRGVSFKF